MEPQALVPQLRAGPRGPSPETGPLELREKHHIRRLEWRISPVWSVGVESASDLLRILESAVASLRDVGAAKPPGTRGLVQAICRAASSAVARRHKPPFIPGRFIAFGNYFPALSPASARAWICIRRFTRCLCRCDSLEPWRLWGLQSRQPLRVDFGPLRLWCAMTRPQPFTYSILRAKSLVRGSQRAPSASRNRTIANVSRAQYARRSPNRRCRSSPSPPSSARM